MLITTILSFKSILHSNEEDSNLEWLRLKENSTSGIITLFSVLHMLNLAFLLSNIFPDINNCFVASKIFNLSKNKTSDKYTMKTLTTGRYLIKIYTFTK